MSKKSDKTFAFSPLRLIKSFFHAFSGVAHLIKNEKNIQVHTTAILVVCSAGLFFKIETWEWCVVLLCFGLVWGLEALNASLEKLCDHISPEKSEAIKQVKDGAAAGVLVAAIITIVIAAFIFLPKVLTVF